MCDYRRGFGLDIRFIDHLQVVTTNDYNTLALSTLYKITPSFPACSVFTTSCLIRGSNNGYSSASGLSNPLSTAAPLQLCSVSFLHCLLYRTDLVTTNCLPYKSSARRAQTTPFILVSVAGGTCLPSRSLAAAVYSCLLRICCVTTDVVSLSVSRP
jgi:hypothetical protein